MLPIVYSLFSIQSSSKCGPFSKIPEIQFSYEIVNWTINLLNVKLISSVYKMVMSPTVILIRVKRLRSENKEFFDPDFFIKMTHRVQECVGFVLSLEGKKLMFSRLIKLMR